MTLFLVEQENRELAIYPSLEQVPEDKREDVFVTESIPEGNGQLRINHEKGELFYEPYPEATEPPDIEQPTKPEHPQPIETLEERIARLETIIEQNNLITVDAVLGVYEELVALREEIAAKGTTDNA